VQEADIRPEAEGMAASSAAAAGEPAPAAKAPSVIDAEQEGATMVEALLVWHRLSNKWYENSCWTDAELTLWEHAQRWLLVLHDRSLEPSTPPPLPLPQDTTLRVGVRGKLRVSSELGSALRHWWEARVKLITARVPLTASVADATLELQHLRTSVRLALIQRIMNLSAADSEMNLQQMLQVEMGEFGSAFNAAVQITTGASAFLRISGTPQCPKCGDMMRSGSDISTAVPIIPVTAEELIAAEGDAFAALDAKLNRPDVQPRARDCRKCSKRSRFLWKPLTSIASDGPPELIQLELPDNPPPALPYKLRPSEVRTLSFEGEDHGRYRLIGLLMYRKGYHFIADVLDPCEVCWLRYDGMDANGVGQPIECTGGAVRHRGGRYYPTMAVYARERNV
jgi:hypothetical protein